MELKKILKIFKKNLFVFLVTLLAVVGIGAGYKVYKNGDSKEFNVHLLINVTRNGIQETDSYRYDDFYRLQADERFADTVVQWIKNPRIVTDVYNETGKVSGDISQRELSRFFSARRLSSQAIEVKFKTGNVIDAQDLSENLVKTVNNEIKRLNQFQKDDKWFKVVGDEPVIKEYKLLWKDVLLISIALGIFLGIWAALIRHYLTRE